MRKYKQKDFNYKRAFTLVEIMLLLVVFSLVLAASYSVITRKHKLKPTRTVHGQYICMASPTARLDDDNPNKDTRNYELYYSGSTLIRSGFVDVTEDNPHGDCKFDIPTSASYIHVQMIGGGGAGGNSNYNPVDDINNSDPSKNDNKDGDTYFLEHRNTKAKYISYVASYPATSSSAQDVYARINKENGINDDAVTNWSHMGVTRDYVNRKFNLSARSGPLFSADLFKYLVNNYIIEKVFAYDYGGSGESGGGFLLQGLDESNLQCLDHANMSECFNRYVTNNDSSRDVAPDKKHYVENPSVKCVAAQKKAGTDITEEMLKKRCPLFFQEYYIPQYEDKDPRMCGGGQGGKGSVFASSLIDWDFETYPILGMRWPNYNEITDGERTYGMHAAGVSDYADLFAYFRANSTLAAKVIDWVRIRSMSPNDAVPRYSDDSVVAGTFKDCPTGSSACKTFTLDGGSTKNLAYDTYTSNSTNYSGKIPAFSTEPKFLSEKKDTPEAVFDSSEWAPGKIYIPTPTLHSGGYPYFDGSLSNVGIRLHRETPINSKNVIQYGVNESNARLTGTGDDKFGVAGTNIPKNKEFVNNKFKSGVWDVTGKSLACPDFGITDSASGSSAFRPYTTSHIVYGDDGYASTNVNQNKYTFCIGNMAFKMYDCTSIGGAVSGYCTYSHTHYSGFMTGSSSGTSAFYQNPDYMCKDQIPDLEERTPISLKESDLSLGVFLHYYNKYITYGDPGKTGEYVDFFTRLSGSNTIMIRPGKGGKINDPLPANSTDYFQAPGVLQNGEDSSMYYNCDSNNQHCMSQRVRGGIGGNSGLKDVPQSLMYNNHAIRLFADNNFLDGPGIVHYSSNSPEELCQAVNQTEPACDGSFRSADTKFQSIAPLINLRDDQLPEKFRNVNFSLSFLGKGGNGAYARDNCWIIPQFFAIRHGTLLGKLMHTHHSGYGYSGYSADKYHNVGVPDSDESSDKVLLANAKEFANNVGGYVAVRTLLLGNITRARNEIGDAAYTAIFKTDVSKCRDAKGENAVSNTDGVAGNPGAVIITW